MMGEDQQWCGEGNYHGCSIGSSNGRGDDCGGGKGDIRGGGGVSDDGKKHEFLIFEKY